MQSNDKHASPSNESPKGIPMMKILMAEHNVWGGNYKTSGHHLAECFVNMGHELCYLSGLLNPYQLRHLVKRSSSSLNTCKMLRTWISGGSRNNKEAPIIYTPMTLLPVTTKVAFCETQFVFDNTMRFTFPRISKKLNKLGFSSPDVLIVTLPNYYKLFDILDVKVKIFRITDNLMAFEDIPHRMKDLVEQCIDKADIVIVTAQNLINEIPTLERACKLLYIPNAVDFQFYQTASKQLPTEYRALRNQQRVVYIGAIDYWFDLELLISLAQRFSNVDFIIIGSPRRNIDSAKQQPNIYFLGRRPYETLPAYLWHANAGIVPFRKVPVIESISPLKVYEYLSCGLPTVSIAWKELRFVDPPVYLAENKTEFIEALSSALDENDERTEEYMNFARQNSWKVRANSIMRTIQELTN